MSASTFAALKGKKIAIVEGYSYGDTLDNAGPTFVRSRTEEDSLSQLLNSAVDYTLMDELVVRYITSNYPKEAQARLQVGSTPLLTRPLYLAIRKDLPNAQSIVDRFNAQIRAMITDRTYHRLLHLDWITADVDGDGIAELVPRGDRVGAVAPKAAYSISTVTDKPATKPPSGNAAALLCRRKPLHRLGQRAQLCTKWRTRSVRTRVARRGRSSRSGGNPALVKSTTDSGVLFVFIGSSCSS